IAAAYWCQRQTKKHSELRVWWFYLLIGLVYSIGIGSALFHSIATYWAQAADVIPIAIFLLAYIGLYGRYLARFTPAQVVGLYILFAALTGVLALSVSREAANGSNMYFGTFAMLWLFAW